MSSIVVYKHGSKAEELPLEPARPLSIGRGPANALQLEEDVVSRRHAVVAAHDGTFLIRDLGSANGTFLNGRKLNPNEPARLRSHDRVRLGHHGPYELEFHIVDADAVEPADAADRRATTTGSTPSRRSRPIVRPLRPEPLMGHLLKQKIPVWSEGKIAVRVADIVSETHDTRTYRFVGAEGPAVFSYMPGQFVTLIVTIDGKEEQRSFSLSSTPSRPHCVEITVKRFPGRLVSNWLADKLRLGDVVHLCGPSGRFTCFEYPSDKLLFIGGGSGITPLMSMTRWILDTAADADLKFLVSARTPADIVFRRELEFLAARHRTFQCAVTVTGTASGTDFWLGQTGRVNREMLELFAPDLCDRHVFTCGPEPFMATVADGLEGLGFPMTSFHKESFGPDRVAKGTLIRPRDAISLSSLELPLPGKPGTDPARSLPRFKIEFGSSAKTIFTSGQASLLELAEANGVEIDYACRTGACGLCKVACKPGATAVEMPDGHCLDAEELADGRILTCVARPVADLEIDA